MTQNLMRKGIMFGMLLAVCSGAIAQTKKKPAKPPVPQPTRTAPEQQAGPGPSRAPERAQPANQQGGKFVVRNRRSMDERFVSYKEPFIQIMWRMYPTWASSVGYHKYDSVLTIPDEKSRMQERTFCMNNLNMLHRFDYDSLSDVNKTDYKLMENQLNYTLFNLDELKAWEWDPSQYNVSGVFADMLSNEYEPLDNRLRNFYKRLDHVPAYYEAAKNNIKNPTKEHTELAIEQNKGGLSVFKEDLEAAMAKSGLSKEEKDNMRARAAKAVYAVDGYIDMLKKVSSGGRSFRLGKELYAKKFEFELQSGYTADQVYAKAVKHKEELHKKMYGLAVKLWPKYMSHKQMPKDRLQCIKEMIGALSVKHAKPQEFQAAIEKQIPALVEFVKKKDLVFLDPKKPLVVRKEPAYMAGVAGASINAPGPYDKNGNTYYNVGSLDGWEPYKAESYLREYNHYILQILNIHEAIPGHYTQLVYANRSPSMIKSILGNNAMIEGWAVYSELMMLENGYDGDNPDAKEASDEMWLMYYKWNLRSTCNAIIDHDVHAGNMGKNEVMSLLTKEAFQESAEAEGKWKRVSVTQAQLSCYFTGFTEIYDLREEIRAQQKDKFSLRGFHERFLSYGSAPVKYIRQMMMSPDGKADR